MKHVFPRLLSPRNPHGNKSLDLESEFESESETVPFRGLDELPIKDRSLGSGVQGR